MKFTVDSILREYSSKIEGQFATRGLEPSSKEDQDQLNSLRALRQSRDWRSSGQEELRKIHTSIAHMVQLLNTPRKLTAAGDHFHSNDPVNPPKNKIIPIQQAQDPLEATLNQLTEKQRDKLVDVLRMNTDYEDTSPKGITAYIHRHPILKNLSQQEGTLFVKWCASNAIPDSNFMELQSRLCAPNKPSSTESSMFSSSKIEKHKMELIRFASSQGMNSSVGQDLFEKLRSTIALDVSWNPTVHRYSSTNNTYSWDARYPNQLCDAIQNGAPTLDAAHLKAANNLRNSPVNISQAEADRMNAQDKSDLTQRDQQFFVPMKPGVYKEEPQSSQNSNSSTSWRFAPDAGGEVVIFVGTHKKHESDDRFIEEANRIKELLEKTCHAKVRISVRPSELAVEDNIKALGHRVSEQMKSGSATQAMVMFIGHGGESTGGGSGSWSEISEGSFWSREENARGGYVSIKESKVKQLVNTYIPVGPSLSMNLVVSSCESGSWIS